MMSVSTIEQLKAMKFSAMAKAFQEQMNDPKTFSALGFEERFGLMVDAEWNKRQDNKRLRYVRDANLDIPSARMEDVEYHEDRGLDKTQLLRLSTCAFIEDKHHIILTGAAGCGKTYIACALGYAACCKFKKVRYVRIPGLLDELMIARSTIEADSGAMLKKITKMYSTVDLLILDEWLQRSLTVNQSFDLLDIIEARRWPCAPSSLRPRRNRPIPRRVQAPVPTCRTCVRSATSSLSPSRSSGCRLC